MYLNYYRLQEKPFNITPNPRFVFLSRQHREVFAHLLYGLQSRCGFIEITGEVGAGKTTMLRTLFEQLADEEFRLALIFNPSLSAEELMAAICREFGLLDQADDRHNLLERLNRFLLDENAAGRTVVLVIDEAQNLTAPVLEQIRLLSNLETETDKLIQIVLVGQPELGALLAQPNLRQLSQRIAVRYHLRPMDRQDTEAYIQHRLQIAGAEHPEQLMASSALRAIFRASGGLPRLINVLCDRALLAAYSADSRLVDSRAVKLAVAELQRPQAVRWSGRLNDRWTGSGPGWWLAGGLLAVGLVVGLAWFGRLLPVSSVRSAAEVAASADAAVSGRSDPGLRADRLAAFRQSLVGVGEEESFSRAMTAMAGVCGADRSSFPQDASQLDLPGSWRWLRYQGDFGSLLRFNTPFLLELRLPAVAGRRFVAVTTSEAGLLRTAPDRQGLGLTASELQALYSGRAWVPWQNFLGLGAVTVSGQSGLDVIQLQSLLQQSGDYTGDMTGSYDSATIAAVTGFQSRVGIVPDGLVGPLTLMLLYRHSTQFHPPRLAAVYGGQ